MVQGNSEFVSCWKEALHMVQGNSEFVRDIVCAWGVRNTLYFK